MGNYLAPYIFVVSRIRAFTVCRHTFCIGKAMAAKCSFEMPDIEVTFHTEPYKFRRLNRYWPPNWAHYFSIPVYDVSRTLAECAARDIYIMEQSKAANER